MRTKNNWEAEITIDRPEEGHIYFGTAGLGGQFQIRSYGHTSRENAIRAIREVVLRLNEVLDGAP